ncbi:APC family permease [Halorubellus sp. PRR65]|uniref:APC family permease n=1 Tax=Halorubellus sp. PRR65 TaxID=3098148 RepID=UPI002B2581EC|nr:APC family permease [Halorubellus sp. PRR65]
MTSENLGLVGAVSMALGGMIGGGIYAVLGVVAGIAGTATWVAFALAGVVALAAGYSFNALNRLDDGSGGGVTFVQSFADDALGGRVDTGTMAGMVGWTLLVGYVGSMAMYAFAFAEFALWFDAVPEHAMGVGLRPAISVLAVAGFVALNLLGAQTTGVAEAVLVALKVGILLAFGVVGVAYAVGYAPEVSLQSGLADLGAVTPLMGAAISFVAFQGWQLLFYDQESIADPVSTIKTAVYVSIPVAVGIYVLVAVVTTNLVPQALEQHPHTALVDAARTMVSPWGVGGLAAVVVSASALFSTGSAINATLFSSAHFAKGLLSADLLPDQVGDAAAEGLPTRTVLVLGAITAALAAWGSLDAITSFASLAFILVFGGVSALAFAQRDRDAVDPVLPAVGAVGAFAFFPLMFLHLYAAQRETFWLVLAVAGVVIAVELLYFERDVVEREAEHVENVVEDGLSGD